MEILDKILDGSLQNDAAKSALEQLSAKLIPNSDRKKNQVFSEKISLLANIDPISFATKLLDIADNRGLDSDVRCKALNLLESVVGHIDTKRLLYQSPIIMQQLYSRSWR